MKKTQFCELFQTIKKTRVSFIAIAMFMCLGLSLFTGLEWGGLAFFRSAVSDMADHRFMNFECMNPYGFDEATVEAVRNTEGVDFAEGSYGSSQCYILDNNKIQIKVVQITPNVNRLFFVEGRLPEKSDEIAVEKHFAENNGIRIGDTVSFFRETENSHFLHDLLNEDVDSLIHHNENTDIVPGLLNYTFTVTALAESPQYIAASSGAYGAPSLKTFVPYSGLMFVSEQAFDKESAGGYSYIHVYSKQLEGLDYRSEEYLTGEEELKARLQPILDQSAEEKNRAIKTAADHIIGKYEEELADAFVKITDAEKEIQDGEKELAEAEAELDSAEQTLIESRQQVTDGYQKLDGYKAQLAKAEKQLAEKEKQLAEKEAEINEFRQQLAEAKKQLELLHSTIASGNQKISEMEAELSGLQAYLASLNGLCDLIENPIQPLFSAILNAPANAYPYVRSICDGTLASINAELLNYAALDPALAELSAAFGTWTEMISQNEAEFPSFLSDAENMALAFTVAKEKAEAEILNCTELIGAVTAEIEKARAGIQILEAEYSGKNKDAEDADKELASYEEELATAKRKLNAEKAELKEYKAYIAEEEQRLILAELEIQNGEKQLREARAELKENYDKLKESKSELKGKRDEYNRGVKDLDSLKEMTASIEDVRSVISTRSDNSALYSIQCVLSIFEKIKYTMALCFLFIGLLVCYCTISEIVIHSRKQIGTKKSMGMTKRETTAFFIWYAGIASVTGALAGLLLSRFVLEGFFMSVTKSLYFVESAEKYFDWTEAGIALVGESLLALSVAYTACDRQNREKPITLLNDVEQKAARERFYEKWTLWKRISLFHKTIINNGFNNKRRVLDTLIGVCGCTTLIIAAFTVSSNLDSGFALQFDKLQNFDTVIYYDLTNDSCRQRITGILDENGVTYANAYFSVGNVGLESSDVSCYNFVLASDDERMESLLHLYTDNIPQVNDGGGVWLTRSYNNAYDVEPGDMISYTDPFGQKYEFPVSGIYDYYLPRYQLVVDKGTYEELTGTQLQYNAFLLDTGLKGIAELNDALMEIDGYISTENYYEQIKEIWQSFDMAIKGVVGICLVLAIILAFFVVLNLFSMFVDEKRDEVIVLMINGYSRKAARKYIYYDNAFLGLLGVFIGTVLGSLLGNMVLISISTEQNYYFRGISWPAVGLGAVISLVIICVMSVIAVSKVNRFKYSDVSY